MKMNFNNIKTILAAALSLVVVSCQSDNGVVKSDDLRTVDVYAAETRTTIDYEASDVSHLEWCEWDQVAYVTELSGDTFKVADMKRGTSGWYFSAQVQSAAKQIHVIYPVGDNEGKTLAEAKASLKSNIEQYFGEPFHGELLPMMASAALEAANRVDVVYTAMASVLRLSVGGFGHENEILKSVTLKANEALAGDYTPSADGQMVFAGTSNSIKVDIKTYGETVHLGGKINVYMVVPSAAFTGVDVVVESDLDSYSWSGGSMDLSHPERRLYRIDLDLNSAEGAPQPETKYFAPVLSESELSEDALYLIAVKSGSKYYVANNQPTDTANYYYVTAVELDSDDNGVVYSQDALAYTWTIKDTDKGYMFYSPNMEKQGTMGVYLITQGGTGTFGQENGYEGKAWFVTEDKLPTGDGELRAYWDIFPDGNGNVSLYNKYVRADIGERAYYKYCTAHNYFTLCLADAEDKAEVALLKYCE